MLSKKWIGNDVEHLLPIGSPRVVVSNTRKDKGVGVGVGHFTLSERFLRSNIKQTSKHESLRQIINLFFQ